MDIDDYKETLKSCYKCDQHSVLQNLNIVYNATNTTIVLWNKFQIFVYENLDFESASKVIIPEFQIQRLLSSSNYLICLDYGGNVHVTSLKFKNPTQKKFKTSFQPKEQGIVACAHFAQDTYILSLKCESNTYFLLLNKINTEFQLVRKFTIICNDGWKLSHTQDKSVFISNIVTEDQLDVLKKNFKMEDNVGGSWSLVFVSFDRLVIYACLFNPKITEECITFVKLYVCPSEICSLEMIDDSDIYLAIGLTIGTIIRLCLKDLSQKPEIVHLNTALYKIYIHTDTAIYTDGVTMWKAENIFSSNIKFNKLFIKNVKDFIKFGDQVICTTFTNLIYTFQIDDHSVYIKTQSIDEYCSAEKILDNAEYLQKIMEEVDKNNQLITKLNKERSYITALSLSNRQDIMESVISCKAIVYENYYDAINECAEIKLTENFRNYNTDSSFILINIALNTLEHKFDDVLSNLLGDLKVHTSLFSEKKLLKSTSITIMEQLKNFTFLMPLKITDIDTIQMNVNIKLLSNIPGVYDEKQMIWPVLYRKNIKLNSEHFIRTNFNTNKNICLKEPQESLEELILKTAVNQYGNLFEFNNISRIKQSSHWPMYIKLPDNCKNMLRSKNYYENRFNCNKTSYFLQQFSCEDFFKCKRNLTFVVNDEKCTVKLIDDGFSSPLLKVMSGNMKLALDLRNFFSNVIYNDFTNFGTRMELISSTFYTTVENLQKSIQDCIAGSSESEQLTSLIEQFERHVVGALPI